MWAAPHDAIACLRHLQRIDAFKSKTSAGGSRDSDARIRRAAAAGGGTALTATIKRLTAAKALNGSTISGGGSRGGPSVDLTGDRSLSTSASALAQ